MQLKRQFERRGSLWVPDCKVTPERLRYERYKKRFLPQAAFTHVRGAHRTDTLVTTSNLVMGAAPATGNLVGVAAIFSVAVTALTVKDSNNNSYTVTTNSPGTFQSGAGQVWLAYLLSAPANATATITLAWTTTASVESYGDEFSVTGGTAAFDKDAKANTGVAGTSINTPSITPAGSGELLYAAAAAGGTITAPAAGATLGVWTGSDGGISATGDMAEYDLSAGVATAVQFTQSSGGWAAMAMAFSISGGSFVPDEDTWNNPLTAKQDYTVTVY